MLPRNSHNQCLHQDMWKRKSCSNLLLKDKHNQFLHKDMWKKRNCNNMWAMEKNFSNNFLKKNWFVALFLSGWNQEPKSWWNKRQNTCRKNLWKKKQCLRQRRAKKIIVNEDEFQWTQMGQTNWFGGHAQPVMDYAKRRHVRRFFTNLGSNKG
jgi:hypothetical protein